MQNTADCALHRQTALAVSQNSIRILDLVQALNEQIPGTYGIRADELTE